MIKFENMEVSVKFLCSATSKRIQFEMLATSKHNMCGSNPSASSESAFHASLFHIPCLFHFQTKTNVD